MKYEDFKEYVNTKCIPEAIYKDTEGREILVITMLEAFNMTRWIEEKSKIKKKSNSVVGLFVKSKQNHEAMFGPSSAADWIYSDLLDLLEENL
jgi:hypothetical protein